MPEQDPLAQLRDIHLPEAIGFWPPAPGWWLLAILLLALLCYGYLTLRRRQQRNRYRKLALAELVSLQKLDSNSEYLKQVNQLLKKTAIAAQPALPVAGLSGQPWLNFLDVTGSTTGFSQGAGQVLATGPYSNPDAVKDTDRISLHLLCQQWIKQHQVTSERTEQLKDTAVNSAHILSTTSLSAPPLPGPPVSDPTLKEGVN